MSQVAPGNSGRSAEFFKKMYDRISALGEIGVWECDLATEALTWTDTVYDLFDLPRQSPVSRAATLACYEPNSRRKMEELRARAIATCSTFAVDVAIRSVQGNSRWIRITGAVEQENGRAVRIFGTKQNITKEKVAQLQVQALQTELIHLSRLSAIDAMRSTLAHELNQPLAAMAVYVSALRRLLGDDVVDREATVEVLDGLQRCALKAGGIIRSVRNISSGRQRRTTLFDLGDAIRDACAIALAGAPSELTVAYTLRDGLQGVGDLVQIQQVLINLIRNACDALAGCERPEIAIATDEKDGFAEVSVRDSGPGISPEVMATLFESFVSTKPEGTGIGLSISRTIIEAHTGKLTACNNREGGATFRFTLPAAPLALPHESQETNEANGRLGMGANSE